jgi:hypothetical protein
VNWSAVPSPTEESLWDIYLLSSTEGWAVGSNGIILHYGRVSWMPDWLLPTLGIAIVVCAVGGAAILIKKRSGA